MRSCVAACVSLYVRAFRVWTLNVHKGCKIRAASAHAA
jgi:hypothetical protein